VTTPVPRASENAPSPATAGPSATSARRWIVAIFAAGSVLQVWMILRSWVYFDQVLLLRLGLRWALDHELVAWGKVITGGGAAPGCALQLAIGLPLSLWMDLRSPLLLVFVSHLVAGIVLVRLLWRTVAVEVALWFAVLYWLSPWRLFHGGFLWEPHLLLLPGALTLWTSFCLRAESPAAASRRVLASLLLASIVTVAPQLHASGALLGLHFVLLWLFRRVRPHLGGLMAGGLLGALPMLPAVRAFFAGELPPWAPEGLSLGRLLGVHHVLKSALLWVRLSSAETWRRLLETVFLRDYGGAVDAAPPAPSAWLWAGPLMALAIASAALALIANLRTLRSTAKEEGALRWLLDAARLALLALLVATAVTPVSPQIRYLLVLLHFACLPVAVWLARTLPSAARLARWGILALVLVRLPVALALALGHPMYRQPDDPVQRALLHGEGLERLELVPAPFGSGKERELPVAPR